MVANQLIARSSVERSRLRGLGVAIRWNLPDVLTEPGNKAAVYRPDRVGLASEAALHGVAP
jgi:hypothetical protein